MDLYIGNLPNELGSEGLKKFVAAYANFQKAKVIKSDGVSRGFGFVTVSDTEAEEVIQKLNGAILEGKKLSVRKAYQKKPVFKRCFISEEWWEKADEKI